MNREDNSKPLSTREVVPNLSPSQAALSCRKASDGRDTLIDTQTETIIAFSDARNAVPGIDRRLSLATLHRWRLHGVRGVKLETVLIGGMRYTSHEAIARFIAAQNANETQVHGITRGQRKQQSEAAQDALETLGI